MTNIIAALCDAILQVKYHTDATAPIFRQVSIIFIIIVHHWVLYNYVRQND